MVLESAATSPAAQAFGPAFPVVAWLPLEPSKELRGAAYRSSQMCRDLSALSDVDRTASCEIIDAGGQAVRVAPVASEA